MNNLIPIENLIPNNKYRLRIPLLSELQHFGLSCDHVCISCKAKVTEALKQGINSVTFLKINSQESDTLVQTKEIDCIDFYFLAPYKTEKIKLKDLV